MNRQYPALELDKVLELLAQHTSCEDARLAALNLEPQTDLASAQALMNQTRDAHMLLARFGGPAFGGKCRRSVVGNLLLGDDRRRN